MSLSRARNRFFPHATGRPFGWEPRSRSTPRAQITVEGLNRKRLREVVGALWKRGYRNLRRKRTGEVVRARNRKTPRSKIEVYGTEGTMENMIHIGRSKRIVEQAMMLNAKQIQRRFTGNKVELMKLIRGAIRRVKPDYREIIINEIQFYLTAAQSQRSYDETDAEAQFQNEYAIRRIRELLREKSKWLR